MVREVCTLSLPSFETFPILSSLFSSSDRSLLDDSSSSFQLLSHFSYSLGVPCHSLVLQPNNPYGFSDRSLLDDSSSSFQLLSHFSYSLGVPCHSLVLQPNNPYGFSECHLEKCPWIYFTRKGPTALLVSLSFLVRH